MIELQTSNENAFALYSLLSGGQRNGIRVNGTLLSEIRRRGLLVYMNNQCIRSSLYFEDSLLGSCGPNEEMIITDRGSHVLGYIWNIPNPEPKYYVFYRKTLLSLLKSWEEVNEFVNKLNPAVWKYISVCDNPDREGLLSWAGGLETIGTFEEALNEENAYVKSMANEIIGEIRNAKIGSLSIWVDGKHIQWFDNKDEVIRYIEANIKRETDVIVQFNGITAQGPEMKYEEFKKQTSKFVFKDNDSSD